MVTKGQLEPCTLLSWREQARVVVLLSGTNASGLGYVDGMFVAHIGGQAP